MVVINLLPFFIHDIYADTITTSNIIGADRILVSSDLYNSDSSYNYWNVAYNIEVKLDKSYLGWINCSVSQQYNQSTLNGNTYQTEYKTLTTASRTYYVNGNSFLVPIVIQTRSPSGLATQNNDPANYFNPSVTLNSSNVTEMASLQTLDDIIVVLEDIKTLIDIDVMNELTNIVTDLGLSNQYLDTLTKLRQYNIPWESLSLVFYNVLNNYNKIYEISNYYSFQYPIFNLSANDKVFRKWFDNNNDYYFIFADSQNINTSQQFLNNYSISSNISLSEFERIDVLISGFNLVKIKFHCTSSGNAEIVTLNNCKFIPIMFCWANRINYISTDFALYFGLSNQLLSDLHIIANGTNQSNQSASNLQNQNDDVQDIEDEMFTYENTFNSNMNDALQQIDTSFDIGTSFNSKFLLSADWVRAQFNSMTNNNPFGTLLSFSLLLGVSLLIIGKVLG